MLHPLLHTPLPAPTHVSQELNLARKGCDDEGEGLGQSQTSAESHLTASFFEALGPIRQVEEKPARLAVRVENLE